LPHSIPEILKHILDEAAYLESQTSTIDRAEFLGNETLKRAFVRSLEIIGEAVKLLADDFRQSHAYIPWRSMAGMRDRLIHGYFGVDYEIVWDAVITNVPQLKTDVLAILRSLESDTSPAE
jgi:uncharacterized protein with HEPN domain